MPTAFEQAPKIKFTPEQRQELVAEFMSTFIEKTNQLGATPVNNTRDLIKYLPDESLIVRRDDPQRLLNTLLNQQDLPLALDTNLGTYANSVEWKPSYGNKGLENAFTEGMSNYHGVAMVWGSKPSADLQISKVPDLAGSMMGIDRSAIRSARGTIHPKDLRFISLRIPNSLFPTSLMTDDELEEFEETRQTNQKPQPIFRHYLFSASK